MLARNDVAKENSGRHGAALTELAAGSTILYSKSDSSMLHCYSITDAEKKGRYGWAPFITSRDEGQGTQIISLISLLIMDSGFER
jgi:hypothetical protein